MVLCGIRSLGWHKTTVVTLVVMVGQLEGPLCQISAELTTVTIYLILSNFTKINLNDLTTLRSNGDY